MTKLQVHRKPLAMKTWQLASEPNESSNVDANGREGGKEEAAESPDELMAKRMDECRRSWIESASNVALSITSGYSIPTGNEAEVSSGLSHADKAFATRKDNRNRSFDYHLDLVSVRSVPALSRRA